MAMRELVFDIFAIDRASKTLSRIGGEAEAMGGKFGKAGAAIGKGLDVAAAVVIGVGIASVKTAADMETAMTRLTTTAGESSKNIQMVWSGIDKMAGQVGYSVRELASAMYYVESGGYHGAKGLEVLKVAAQGAKIENANVTDVAHALAGAMNDYRKQNLDAASAMNVMTAAVGHGMMTFQDMAEALPKIGARASATGIKFQELMAAIATMTQDGLPASVAATYLGQTIGQLAAPTDKASNEMSKLGINSTALAATITSGSGHGLGDAIKMLYDHITARLTPAGLVAIETFKKSKATFTDFQKLVADIPPNLQTVVEALARSSGGVKAFQGVLMLGGANTKAYNANLAAMNEQLVKGHGAVAGVAEQQKTLNGKLADAKGAWTALLDVWGQQLLPIVTQLAGKLVGLTTWLTHNGPAVKDFTEVILILATAVKVATAAQWLLNIALDANPIGIVILALGALVTAFVLAYNHSATFRRIVQMAWDDVRIGVLAMSIVAITALHSLVSMMLAAADNIVSAAAVAFGWVPGLGPKLMAAAHAVHDFRDNANAELNKIQNNLEIHLQTAIAAKQYDDLVAHMTGHVVSVPVALTTNYTSGMINVTGVGRINAGQLGGAGTLAAATGLKPSMRASGGPIDANTPYWVGEQGPELVIPRKPGQVIDARKSKAMAGGGGLHIENFYAGNQSPDSVASALMWKFQHS